MSELKYPVYLPDATRGVVKALDFVDVKYAGVEAVVVNTLHLNDTLGSEFLHKMGGIKKLMNFNGFVTSDSGGWQIFSLIKRRGGLGKITDDGVVFTLGTKNSSKKLFTPTDSINMQMAIGSDLIVCLDDFCSPTATLEQVKESVDRTVLWAKQSKKYFDEYCNKNQLETRPKIMAVIQGGWDHSSRKECTERLCEIGFDAYGFGGYVIDDTTHQLDLEISEYIAHLIPDDKIKFALGVGKPHDISMCSSFGWQMFDCTLPTRDARHKRLYVFNYKPQSRVDMLNRDLYGYVYIDKEIYSHDLGPIDPLCDCHTCKNYSKAYLRHLFKIGDFSAYRLSAIHNIRHFTKVTEFLRALA